MSKNNENKLVSKLRFPEFISDNWAEVSINKLGETINGLAGKSGKDFGTGRPYVTYKQVFDSSKVDFSKCSLVEIAENENQNTLSKGDILFTTSSETPHEVGFASVVLTEPTEPTYLNSFCFAFRPFSLDQLQPAFSQFLFHSPAYRKSIGILAQGITRFNISKGAFLKLKVSLPKNPTEQQKIAACLSSLDEVITAESQKLEVLKDHKKGLLQNLLPQAGETVPKFRFKEFEDSGEWEETTLTQVADYENGKAHEQDIADDGEFIVVNSKFISQDGEVKKFTNTAFLPATKGDVLMVLSDIPNGKAIAKCFLVEEDNRYTVNQRICRITPRNMNSKILYYLLNRNPYFLAFDDGVKQTNLRKEDVLNCPLMIPEDPKEQEKIADTLSSVDELINAQNQKLEALQLHKKGLLQGLFPTINSEE